MGLGIWDDEYGAMVKLRSDYPHKRNDQVSSEVGFRGTGEVDYPNCTRS